MNNTQRLEEYKAEFVKLSLKYEADITAVPQFIPTDNGFKVGAIINVIDKKAVEVPENEQIKEDTEKEQGK